LFALFFGFFSNVIWKRLSKLESCAQFLREDGRAIWLRGCLAGEFVRLVVAIPKRSGNGNDEMIGTVHSALLCVKLLEYAGERARVSSVDPKAMT
jgi:hypothetical protein